MARGPSPFAGPMPPMAWQHSIDRARSARRETPIQRAMTAFVSKTANASPLIAPPCGRWSGRGSFHLLTYAALLAGGIYAAIAQETPVVRPNEAMTFHIPSQPLATALQA